jgi:hypothetical protein
MSWRDQLNQQAVTSGSQYSPQTVSSLRRQDIQSRYDQATSSVPASQPASSGTAFETQTTPQESQITSSVPESQPIIRTQQGTTSATPQAATSFSESLRESVKAFNQAKANASAAKQTADLTKIGIGAGVGALSGNAWGPFVGAGVAMVGSALTPEGPYGPIRDSENYGKAVDLYDVFNTDNYDANPKLDFNGNPISKQDYISKVLRDIYQEGAGTFTDAKRLDLLKRLGIDNSVLNAQYGQELPDISTPEFADMMRNQGVNPAYKFGYESTDFGV